MPARTSGGADRRIDVLQERRTGQVDVFVNACNPLAVNRVRLVLQPGTAGPVDIVVVVDSVAVANMLDIFGVQSDTLEPAVMEAFKFHFKAGHGGYPLVGTPDQIVSQMERLSAMGVDGILLSWVDYLGEARQWIDRVMPLMEQAGLREPFEPR